MRGLLRVALPVIIIIGLVAGLSYVLQYTSSPPAVPKTTHATSNEPSLIIPERTAVWDPNDPYYSREVEFGTVANFDFWVTNPHPVPASVVLRGQSCTKCTDMEFGIVGADAVLKSLQLRSTLGAAQTILGQPGFDVGGLVTATLGSAITWQPLTINDVIRTVPPADPRLGRQFAVIRFRMKANTLGPQRLSAEVNYSGGDSKPAETRFEVPVVVVSPVQIAPNTVKFDDIKAGDPPRFTAFVVWSSTRDHFELQVPKLPDNPNFVFATPRPLTLDECNYVSQRLHHDYPGQPPTRVLAGYSVGLTVYENLNGQLLELGPFSKKLAFNAGTPLEAVTTVSGLVRGDLRVESKNNEELISLGDFRADLPFTKSVLVTALSPNLKLRLVSFSPETLKAALKERPSGGWEIRFDIAANTISGPLPPGSSIILELSGPNPRKVRIPVSGVAFIP